MPTYLIGEALRKGRRVPILQHYPFTAEPIRLIYPSKRHLSPRIRAFIDLLVERWQHQLPWE
nr:LysR substrate-binding domain-containing protein [Pantoea brenneri]